LQDRPDEFGMSVSVSPQKDVEARIPLHGYAPGSVIAGSAVLEGRTQGRLDSTAFPFRAQPIPCDTLATDDAPISWDSVRAVVSDGWRGFGAAGATQIAPTDCSATVRAVATPSALTVRIDVRDDVWYSGEPGAPLWATDSVQIAFDTTVLGSHQPREIEYAVAGRGGEGLVARDRSTIDALPADASDKRIVADVRRIGDVTRYDVSFPWPTLGLAARPAPTDRIALDIAVNDSDGKGLPRHGLEMTDGIVATKETAGFATLVLR
jgi:hypothetical protein